MKDIKAIIEQGGVKVLADAWLAGAFGAKDKCIKKPEDAAGLKVRSAGSTFAQMWAGAGASIVSIPSSEVYNALQQGVAQATDTSSGSFVSFRLYEQLKCITAPGDNALWFMYEPVLISKKSWDKLDGKQKAALMAASKKAEDYFDTESKKLDDELVEIFKKNKVEVVTLSDAESDAWRAVAQKTSYKAFAEKVPGGKETDREGAECQVTGAVAATRLGGGGARRVARLRRRRGRADPAVDRRHLPDGLRARRARRVVDLADRVRHLRAGGGHLHRRALHPADARPCRGRRAAADGGNTGAAPAAPVGQPDRAGLLRLLPLRLDPLVVGRLRVRATRRRRSGVRACGFPTSACRSAWACCACSSWPRSGW